jgi:two-component system, cell cycle response regulator
MLVQRITALQEHWNNDLNNGIPAQCAESPRSRRVLVVDDDAVTRECLSALLKRERFDVEIASSGEEALRVMSTRHFDVVLTDWQMPNMDGLALCRHVRREYKADNIYMLLLTIRDTEEDRLAGIAAGADDYVIKGGPINEVVQRLNVGRSITHATPSFTLGDPDYRLSLTDPLTNVPNVRFFTKQLSREIERARHKRHALAVLCCRIDEFEHANHSYGYAVGDEALRAFVADSRYCIRKRLGWLARVGTDQFMIVLPETRFKRAERVAQKLRRSYAAVPVSTSVGPIKFTVSIAVTAAEPKHGMDSLPQLEDHFCSTAGGFLH